MYDEKNLSKEFKETMEETKEMLLTAAMPSMSTRDKDELATNIKALHLLNRLFDLCGAMFEKQDKLMDKMDKAMDKYLTDDKK